MGRLSVEVNEIGTSKNNAKDEARQILADMGLSASSENIAKLTGIHGKDTMGDYMQRWQTLGEFAKTEFGVKNMELLTGEIVKAFLAEKIELGVAYSTFSGYCAAFTKLESALESFTKDIRNIDKDFGFRSAIHELRQDARSELPHFVGTRNYDDPSKLISSLSGASDLVARIQLESGARISEASKITMEQLRGMTTDRFTGKAIGQFDIIGKGGKYNVCNISEKTYQDVQKHIYEHGSLNLSADTYRNNIQAAAEKTEQQYNGSHGLRWCFAQNRMAELKCTGVGYVQALGQVSREMGHNRISITEHYLGK
jgi:integrase